MIEKLRKKIILLITFILSLIITIIVVAINVSNYNRNKEISLYTLDNFLKIGMMFSGKDRNDDINSMDFNSFSNIEFDNYTFYFVRIYNEYNIDISTNKNSLDSNLSKKLIHKAYDVSLKKNNSGMTGNLFYKKSEYRGISTVVFMENSDIISGMIVFLIATMIFEAIGISIFYLLALRIADYIIKPVEESFERQKQFISDASHELKTPLTIMSANVQMLESEIDANKRIESIKVEIDKMSELVTDLLDLTKIKDDYQNVKAYENISEIVTASAMSFESLTYEKKIKLDLDIEENLKINCNKKEINQLVSILVDNAIKHTLEEKNIVISLNKVKNNINLSVKNNGEPIPKEHIDKIFERFYRVDEARNSSENRYGLGLAIAKSIVEKHDAFISVKCLDGWTEFTVLFKE